MATATATGTRTPDPARIDGPPRVADALRARGFARGAHYARHLILQGRVSLDGHKVHRPAATIPPGRHTIRVDVGGRPVAFTVNGHDDFRV